MKFKNNKDFIDGSEFISEDNIDKYEISGSFFLKHYSPSFINSWYECPAKTLLNALPGNEVPALEIGTAVHTMLEKKYNENIDDEELLKLTNKLPIDNFYICEAREYLKAYSKIKDYENFETEPTYLTEHELIEDVSPLGIDLPLKMKGFIDRLDLTEKGTYIIDYKTASRAPYEDKYIDQMIIYKWLVEQKYGVEVPGVYVASIYKKDPKYIKQDITLKKQSKLIDKIFDVHDESLQSFETKLYKKRKGDYCNWCPIKSICGSDCTLEFDEERKNLNSI